MKTPKLIESWSSYFDKKRANRHTVTWIKDDRTIVPETTATVHVVAGVENTLNIEIKADNAPEELYNFFTTSFAETANLGNSKFNCQVTKYCEETANQLNFQDCFCQSIQYGDLSVDSNNEMVLEMVLRFNSYELN